MGNLGLNKMWPFPKKPIFRKVSEEFLGYEREFDHVTCDTTTFSTWAVTFEDVETGKRKVEKQLKLEL